MMSSDNCVVSRRLYSYVSKLAHNGRREGERLPYMGQCVFSTFAQKTVYVY